MHLHYYGTGAAEGIPALFCTCDVCKTAREKGGREIRTRSGAMIDGVLKVDLPPDTYHHLITYGVDITYLEHLLVTHPHEDHYAVHEILYRTDGFAQLTDDVKPLFVYGGKEVGALLEQTLAGRAVKKPRALYEKMIPFKTRDIEGYSVTALPARHMREAEAFIYLIEKDGRRMLYAHDTGVFFDEVFDYLAGRAIHLISLDCTYMHNDTRDQPENGHMGIPVNRVVRDRLLQSGAATAETKFIVNHFSHNGGQNFDALTAAAEGFIVSYDGMEIDV